MPAAAILWPVAAHLLLIALLYAWLTVERQAAVLRREASLATFRTKEEEPLRARLVSNNLSNQFELPVLFYVLAMTLYATNAVTQAQLGLAWAFVGARLLHTLVHVFSPNVALRGGVFTLNFLALAAMWVLFLWERI
jgi:hypothetical protein